MNYLPSQYDLFVNVLQCFANFITGTKESAKLLTNIMHFILLYYPLKKINYYTRFKILHRTVICPSMTPFASRSSVQADTYLTRNLNINNRLPNSHNIFWIKFPFFLKYVFCFPPHSIAKRREYESKHKIKLDLSEEETNLSANIMVFAS